MDRHGLQCYLQRDLHCRAFCMCWTVRAKPWRAGPFKWGTFRPKWLLVTSMVMASWSLSVQTHAAMLQHSLPRLRSCGSAMLPVKSPRYQQTCYHSACSDTVGAFVALDCQSCFASSVGAQPQGQLVFSQATWAVFGCNSSYVCRSCILLGAGPKAASPDGPSAS